jgi:hypothetical protein
MVYRTLSVALLLQIMKGNDGIVKNTLQAGEIRSFSPMVAWSEAVTRKRR